MRKVISSENPQIKTLIAHIDGLVDKKLVSDEIIRPIVEMRPIGGKHINKRNIQDAISKEIIAVNAVEQVKSMAEAIHHIVSGDCVVFMDSVETALVCSVRGWEDRSVEEAATEPTIRGPRDAFIETLRTNTSLIRYRIKDPSLRVEQFKVGRLTKTDVAVVYQRCSR